MKITYLMCVVLIFLSTSVFADQYVVPTGPSAGQTPPSREQEIQQLIAQIEQARALNREADLSVFERLDELTGEVGGRDRSGSLDKDFEPLSITDERQGGESCADIFTIPGLPFEESGTVGNTDNCVGRPYRDIFYRYTAVQSGSHTFNMCGSAGDTYMRIWTQGTCCVGTTVEDDNSCGTDYDPSITLPLTLGQVIVIECGKYGATGIASPYNFRAFGPASPPANDLCANAAVVAVPSSTMGTTVNSSLDAAPACGGVDAPTSPGVWYRVMGTGNTLTASLCNAATTWDTKLSVYTGPCGSLGCVGGNDNYCGNTSQVSWCSEASVPYFILVHGHLNNTGAFQLDISDDGINCHFSCGQIAACGTPAETEPNDLCHTGFDPLTITCPGDDTALTESLIYGTICPATDHDFYRVLVPGMSVMTITVYSGTNCDSLTSSCVASDILDDTCGVIGSSTTGGWMITNPLTEPAHYFLDMHGNGTCIDRYRISTTCCPIRDYAAAPINIVDVTDYSATINTCCATNPVPFVFSQGCSGTQNTAGRAVVFRITPIMASDISITASGGNAQVMVYTNPANPSGSCIASSDSSTSQPEQIDNLNVSPGVYYIAVSRRAPVCGDVTFSIHSDETLPVELTSFTATAGRNEATLNWQTASESGNDHFDLERDGQKIAQVTGHNSSPTAHSYTCLDKDLENGRTYRYELFGVDVGGARVRLGTVQATPEVDVDAPVSEYALYQNYPNPFNPTTRLAFDLLEGGPVSLRIYNLLGQQVAQLVNQPMTIGHHVVSFDATYLPSGVYLYRLEAGNFVAEKKMLLMK